jgi:hypothetical protein
MIKKSAMIPILLLLALFAPVVFANTHGLEKYAPQTSYVVIGADFLPLHDNEIFRSMEDKGQIWSYEDEDSEVATYFRILKIDPKTDIGAFLYSKYLNPYGTGGKLHVFILTHDISKELKDKSATVYLGSTIYRIDPDQDRYAVLLDPKTIGVGNLNEAKMAVDLQHGKVGDLNRNATLSGLLRKVPVQAAVWGIALPLARRDAAAAHARQTTNPLLSGFQSYYFYGIPRKRNADAHFYGQTGDDKAASVATAFMIGTLTVAKLRADENLAEMLDQVNIEHSGNSIHVSAVVTKEMVDAYFKGKLGVD